MRKYLKKRRRGAPACAPGEAIGYDYSRNIPENTLFAVVFPKSKDILLTGGHTGPPLQIRENTLNRDVGEHRCALPHNNSGDVFFGNNHKKMVFSVEPYNYL